VRRSVRTVLTRGEGEGARAGRSRSSAALVSCEGHCSALQAPHWDGLVLVLVTGCTCTV